MESFVQILTNIVILFGLIALISLFRIAPEKTKSYTRIGIGITIGITTILLMVNSWEMSEGIFFDSRTIILSVTAVYFDPVVSIIATIIALVYRIHIGGDGMIAGSITIIVAFMAGYVYRTYIKKNKQTKWFNLYIFGLVVHILMLVSQLAIPYPHNIEVLKNISAVVLIFFPVATLLLAKSIELYNLQIGYQDLLASSEKKYRQVFENNRIGFIQYDIEGTIELVNETFAKIIQTPKENLIGLHMLKLPNKALVQALQTSLLGTSEIYEGTYTSVTSGHTFPTRVQFSPIIDNDKVIGGIGVVDDLSEQIEADRKIRELTYYDPQTKLLNRASFDRFMFKFTSDFSSPISIGLYDINTLHIINSTFGYEKGNEIIKVIADVLIEETKDKETFTPYRIGGDEFAVVMLNTNKERATKFTDCIQNTIEKIDTFEFDITLTSGVYTTTDRDHNIQEVFNKALDILGSNKIYAKSSISAKTVDVIMTTLFAKSKREQQHSERVSNIALNIAKEFNLGTAFNNRVALAGRLHDIGKITMDTTILDKPGKLKKEELELMQTHSLSGFRILSVVPEYLDIANIVYSHHERMDGQGYPRGLKGHNIPLESRIITVADAFDAMVEERPYKNPKTLEEAIEELVRCQETQFDPDVVAKFISSQK